MLKKILIAVLLLVILGGGYFVTIMMSTGFFRSIENQGYGTVYQKIPLKGAEDITIDYEADLMFISAFDRKGDKQGVNPTGGLFIIDLLKQPYEPVRLADGLGEGFHPHGISVFKKDSGDYHIFVVNHQKGIHTIESFSFNGKELTHLKTHEDDLIVSPNDVVAINEDRFYYTNDHGKTSKLGLILENYLGLSASNVGYYDGQDFRIVAGGIQYANGITVSQDKQTLYVASPRGFVIKKYSIDDAGELKHKEDVPTNTGVDNLEWDTEGNLWSGAHPNLLGFSSYAALKKPIAPSEVVKIKDGNVQSVYLNDGNEVSGPSVAVPYKEFLFIGTVMDEHILVLKKEED